MQRTTVRIQKSTYKRAKKQAIEKGTSCPQRCYCGTVLAMDHLAIMQKSWGLLPKILSGEKTVESRWYLTRRAPWDQIQVGEKIYFKESGEPATVRAEVEKVAQFSGLSPLKVQGILEEFGGRLGIAQEQISKFYQRFKNKKYCILVFLKNSQVVKPFGIDKTGFGLMSAWITVESIDQLR